MKLKNTAFTLIELLVVITIIGILATVSTATFSNNRTKALIAKNTSERVQASKEAYAKCISIHTEHCGPGFIVYSNINDGLSLYQKNVISAPSDPGRKITNNRGHNFSISHNGEFVAYRNLDDNNYLYIKDLNTPPSDPGTLFIESNVGNPLFTLDGKAIIHNEDNIHKKEIGTPPDELGTVLKESDDHYPVQISLDGKSFFFTDGSELIKQNINSSNGGEVVFKGNITENIAIDKNENFIIYFDIDETAIYKKDINSSSPAEVFLNVNTNTFWLNSDGSSLIYFFNGDSYEKSTSDTDPSNLGQILSINAYGNSFP